METGVKISLGGHAVLIIAAIFNGPLFQSDEGAELQIAQVSLISGSELAALEIQTGPMTAAPSDPDLPEQPDPEASAPAPAAAPATPEPPAVTEVTGQVAPQEETAEIANTETALLTPKPAERVDTTQQEAPEAPKAPKPDTSVAPAPSPKPVEGPVKPTIAEPAPSTPVITPKPPRPSAAPKKSPRPMKRADRKPVPVEVPEPPKPAPAPDPAPEPKKVVEVAPIPEVKQPTVEDKPAPRPQNLATAPKTASGQSVADLIAASQAAEAAGSPDGGTTGTAFGSLLNQSEREGLMFAIEKCWNVPAGVRDAENLAVTVGFELHRDGAIKGAVTMVSAQSPDSPLTKVAFRQARSAIFRCLPYDNLPQEKYDNWKKVEVTFNPKEMVLR